MSVKTQGSQLYFIAEETAGPVLYKVACATNLSGLSSPREQIEVTCLESGTREYVGGLSTPGQLTVTVNFDPAEPSHLKLYELWRDNSDNLPFAIGYGGPADTDPTLDSAGEFIFPTTRHFLEFDGYVVDVPHEGGLNAVWTSAMPIQISGPYVLYPKV